MRMFLHSSNRQINIMCDNFQCYGKNSLTLYRMMAVAPDQRLSSHLATLTVRRISPSTISSRSNRLGIAPLVMRRREYSSLKAL